MIYVVGPPGIAGAPVQIDSGTSSPCTELGLSSDQVRITPVFRHKDIVVEGWGESTPETQFMGAEFMIRFTLINFDRAVLNTCLMASMAGGGGSFGTLPQAGTLMGGGNGSALRASGNYLLGLGLGSPIGQQPWRFYACYLANQPVEYPLGAEKTAAACTWRAIAYPNATGKIAGDPAGEAAALDTPVSSYGVKLWDNISPLTAGSW